MDVFALTMRLKEEGAATVQASLNKMRGQMRGATTDAQRLDQQTQQLSGSLKTLLSGVIAGVGIREVARMSDSWVTMTARLGMVTKNTEELAQVQRQLFQIAQQNRAPLEEISTLYLRTANAATALGLSQDQVLQITRTVAQAVALSGSSAVEAAAAIQQLGQAFGNGAVQAQEWNSIAEQSPRLARAIAESFNMTTAQFRKAVLEQKVSSADLAKGILAANKTVAAEAAKLPLTISGAITQMRNEVSRFVNEINKSTGAAQAIVGLFGWFKDNLPIIVGVITTATAAWVAYRAVLIGVTAVQAAQAAATALASKNLGQLLGLAAGGATAVAVFLEVSSRLTASMKDMGTAAATAATGLDTEKLSLSGGTKEARARMEVLTELAMIAPITQAQSNELSAEYERLTTVLKAGNIALERRLQLEQQRAAIAEAQAAATVITPAKEIEAMERRMGQRIGTPIQAGFTPPAITRVDPRVAEAARQSAQRFGEVVDNSYAQEFVALRQRLAVDLGMTLADALAAGIETAVATGSISQGFKALANSLLQGLGGMMIQFGKASLIAAGFMDTIFKALAKALPGGAIVASLGMIAAGAALKGAAGAAFGGARGGGGGGGGGSFNAPSFAMAGGSAGLPNLFYGPTSAGSASTIQQMQPMSVTIIGPNDPSAQRQMQELMRNAQRRGNV